MVLDDEIGFQELLSEYLQALGHRVTMVRTGLHALEVARRCRFDLLLVDQRMPGITGIDFLRQLRLEGNMTLAIVMTAYAEVPVVVASMRFGVADFLVKPFQLDTLLPMIERCLAQANPEKTVVLERAHRQNGGCHD